MITEVKIQNAYKALAAAVIKTAINDAIKKNSHEESAVYFLENMESSIYWELLNNGQTEADKIAKETGVKIKDYKK